MASRLARYTQKLFGSNATATQVGQFGSYAAGSPAYAQNPAQVQNLANFLTGWFGAVVGNNSPALEDLNALSYLQFYQLAYLMQAGVPEYDSATNYFVGSICQDGAGVLYASLTGTGTSPNIGNALSSATNWRNISGGVNVQVLAASYTVLASDNGKTFLANTLAQSVLQTPFTINLPAPVLGFKITVKDSGFYANFNNINIHRFGTEKIENVQADYVYTATGGEFDLVSDGLNWYILGR